MNQEDQITTQPYPIQLSSWTYGSSSHLKGCYRCYRGCVHPGSEAHGAMSRQIRHSIGRASHQQRENLAGKAEICRDVRVLEGRWPLITQTQTHVLYCILVLFHPCLFSIHLSSFLFLPTRLLFITFPYSLRGRASKAHHSDHTTRALGTDTAK